MCVFTDRVERVSDTQIFARANGPWQLLVYAMRYAARSDLAMVLPIPVVPGSADDALRFVSLQECPDFFEHLASGFPRRYDDDAIGSLAGDDDATVKAAPTLEVHEVGAYEASFVPSPAGFARLDERFRLPVDIWLQLRHYADYGFAVFKLRPTTLAAVHPMAFEFPRRDASRLFFPTLHMHGRTLEAAADFDHLLYCQAEPALNWHLHQWEDSELAASEYVHCREASALVDLRFPCWRAPLEGSLENRDTWVGPGQELPVARAG
jgi:hypothetical protein